MEYPDHIAYKRYCEFCRTVSETEPLDFESWYRKTTNLGEMIHGLTYYGTLNRPKQSYF